MIEIDHALPPGALCDDADGVLEAALGQSGGFWWHGSGLIADPAGRVTAWSPRLGQRGARPTKAATDTATIGEAGDLRGLQCRTGLHCGMMVPDIASDAQTVSLALRYLPPVGAAEAKTLLTYHAPETTPKNYLFVSEEEGQLRVQDNQGHVALSLPAPALDAPRTVLITLTPARLHARILGGATAQIAAPGPVLHGPASLFIGCRNNRGRLPATLGGALITDVWLWPGRDLWATDLPRAFARYHLWAGDSA